MWRKRRSDEQQRTNRSQTRCVTAEGASLAMSHEHNQLTIIITLYWLQFRSNHLPWRATVFLEAIAEKAKLTLTWLRVVVDDDVKLMNFGIHTDHSAWRKTVDPEGLHCVVGIQLRSSKEYLNSLILIIIMFFFLQTERCEGQSDNKNK